MTVADADVGALGVVRMHFDQIPERTDRYRYHRLQRNKSWPWGSMSRFRSIFFKRVTFVGDAVEGNQLGKFVAPILFLLSFTFFF